MKDQFNVELGARLKTARRNKRLSMKALGEMVNLHESTISRYEKGEIQALDIDKVKEFAVALNVTPQYLLGWKDEDDAEFASDLGSSLTYKRKKYFDSICDGYLTNDEFEKITEYLKFLVSQRGK